MTVSTTGHLVDDVLVGLRCIPSLPSLLLDWRSCLMREDGMHVTVGGKLH